MNIASEMDVEDTRAFPRVRVPRSADLMVSFGRLGSQPANATIVNVSRGGLQARTGVRNFSVAEGQDCFVRFLHGDAQMEPASAVGRVCRVENNSGYWLVAIEFEQPLSVVDVPRFG